METKQSKRREIDESQAEVIESKEQYLLVEAPAGYGKTYTMVSMIEHWISSDQIKNFQRILCMTFSTSAANKLKESIEQDSGLYTFNGFSPKRIISTNFHGLCRIILRKYGYLVGLSNIESLKGITPSRKNLSKDKYEIITKLDTGVSNATLEEKSLYEIIPKYNEIILDEFISKGTIPFNSIITFTLQLLNDHAEICKFYNKYFYAVCIDEFQDTNLLGRALIELLLDKQTRFVGFGDPMQRIYGFLGAMPDLMQRGLPNKEIHHLQLKTNHRFQPNSNMFWLDKNIREFNKNPSKKDLHSSAYISYIEGENKIDEGTKIVSLIEELKIKESNATFAILVSLKSPENTGDLLRGITQKEKVFNALFSNEDEEFVKFQDKVAKIYQSNFSVSPIIRGQIDKFIEEVSERVSKCDYIESFLSLLKAFLKKCTSSYEKNSRNEVIISTLQSHSLQQSIKDLEEKVIISTIHGAKGLEWDYVILANFEEGEFPGRTEIDSLNKLSKKVDKNLINKFYVAFSRARSEVYISYSKCHYERNSYTEYSVVPAKISRLSKLHLFNLKKIE